MKKQVIHSIVCVYFMRNLFYPKMTKIIIFFSIYLFSMVSLIIAKKMIVDDDYHFNKFIS